MTQLERAQNGVTTCNTISRIHVHCSTLNPVFATFVSLILVENMYPFGYFFPHFTQFLLNPIFKEEARKESNDNLPTGRLHVHRS